MYQLSQALASGSVKLMDWKSIENANMGGEQFRLALQRTAEVHGVAIDSLIEKHGTFRETLSEGWLTTEIMIETLGQMAGDYSDEQLRSMGYTEEQIADIQRLAETATDAATKVKSITQLMDSLKEGIGSGWATTFEIIIGNFEEARELWTDVFNTISGFLGKSADARNEMLLQWKELGGRTALLNGLKNIFQAIFKVLEPLASAFRELFPRASADQVFRITQMFEKLTSQLIITDKSAEHLRNIFRAIFSVLRVGFNIIKSAVIIIGGAIGGAFKIVSGFLSVVVSALGNLGAIIHGVLAAFDNFSFITSIAKRGGR